MSQTLEWVYKSNGDDLTTAALSTSVANATQMIDDGTYVWVACGTDGIMIYQYFGENSDNEPAWDTLDYTNYTRYDYDLSRKLRLITAIKITSTQILRTTCIPALSLFPTLSSVDPDGTYTISGIPVIVTTLANGERAIMSTESRSGNALNAQYLCKDSNSIFVSNGTTFSEVMKFDIASQTLTSSIFMSAPVSGVYPTMNSNLCQANGKLWAVSTFFDDNTPQSLVSYNISSAAIINTPIPVRPGSAKSWVADGYNSSVYVTNYNNWSVTRFSYSNVFGATIRVNGYPTRIFTQPDKRIWVTSYAGMLSLIDWSDDSVNNSHGTESGILSFDVDPSDSSFVWFTNSDGKVVRQDLNTHKQIEICDIENDWVWRHERLVKYANAVSISVLKNESNQQYHNIVSNTYFDGTNTFHPDLIITNSSGTVKLVEYVDYSVNTETGMITFLPTSTIVTSPTTPVTLKLYYYYRSFFAESSLITPQKTYTSGASTITVKPYLFIISQNMLLAIRHDDKMTYLTASTGVTGQGAVVSGTNQYFGD